MTVEGVLFVKPSRRGEKLVFPLPPEESLDPDTAAAVFQLRLGRKAVIALAAVIGNVGFASISLIVNWFVH